MIFRGIVGIDSFEKVIRKSFVEKNLEKVRQEMVRRQDKDIHLRIGWWTSFQKDNEKKSAIDLKEEDAFKFSRQLSVPLIVTRSSTPSQ